MGCRRVAALAVFMVLMASSSAHLQQGESRQIRRNAGQRIPDLVRSDERSLVIVESADPPLSVGPEPGLTLLEWYYKISDAVVVVEIIEKVSFLTPAGDWIRSRLTGHVLETLATNREEHSAR